MIVMIDDKNTLRAFYKQKRAEILPAAANIGTCNVSALLLKIIKPKQIVAGYYPIGHELNILPTLEMLHQQRCGLALPAVLDTHLLEFRAWDGYKSSLEKREFCIPVPNGKPVVPHVILVPLLAFTKQGERLGSGRGYYDRTLSMLVQNGWHGKIIGIGFSCQEAETLPQEPHDWKMDCVVTEIGKIDCS